MEEDPNSVLSKYPTYEEELDKKYAEISDIPVIDVDRRIALIARIVLERALRSSGEMSRKDKADIALRAISTLEGIKSKSEMWVHDEQKKTVTIEEYEKERQAVEKRIKALLSSRTKRLERTKAAVEQLNAKSED